MSVAQSLLFLTIFRNSLMSQCSDNIGMEFSSLQYLPAVPDITPVDHREVWIEKEQWKHYFLWLEIYANFMLTLRPPGLFGEDFLLTQHLLLNVHLAENCLCR